MMGWEGPLMVEHAAAVSSGAARSCVGLWSWGRYTKGRLEAW